MGIRDSKDRKIKEVTELKPSKVSCKTHRNYKAHYKDGVFQSYQCLDCGHFFDFT
ncbi:hypothetical protein NVP1193O_083 [Vibrio phage 1.193.O._10N.286.52.C6]|nr:hypothetical protein NVP1193O_083 [Vibrio phage 1.193.O._10N.286.52.C6]